MWESSIKAQGNEPEVQAENWAGEKLPFAGLDRAQWRRLLDFAAGVACVVFLLYVGIEAYLSYGVDFRGYYAAALVVRAGGDPYDYDQVAQVLLDLTGEMGNNPYYYPPWFSLLMIPLTLLPFSLSRLIWIALTLTAYGFGAWVALDLLGWPRVWWRRWLAMLSGAYLLIWVSVRSGQLGPWLLALTALSLYASGICCSGSRLRSDRPWLAGSALALLLTKPNVTWLAVPVLWFVYWKHQRPAAWWALGVLAVLLLASTAVLPGWWMRLGEPDFGAGLKEELDGPQRVVALRLNTILRDWLGQWNITGFSYWIVWGLMAAGSGAALWLAWRNRADAVYLVALSFCLGLLLTPYALQYDYPPLALALFWVLGALPRQRPVLFWGGLAVLAFVYTVPLWEHPVYDGYWIVLGVASLLVAYHRLMWRKSA